MAALYFNHDGDVNTAIDYLKKAEAFVEKDGNGDLLQLIYINLAKIYSKLKEFELHEHYQAKLLSILGFGDMFSFLKVMMKMKERKTRKMENKNCKQQL